MIRKLLQFVTAMLLSGCTVNNFDSTSLTIIRNDSAIEHTASTHDSVEPSETTIQTDKKNLRIRPECAPYVPLPVPKPARIDFKELESAETGKEINAIALRNVKELHQQLFKYAVKQQKHYNEYTKRCIVE
jgi:hypothetical protein